MKMQWLFLTTKLHSVNALNKKKNFETNRFGLNLIKKVMVLIFELFDWHVWRPTLHKVELMANFYILNKASV